MKRLLHRMQALALLALVALATRTVSSTQAEADRTSWRVEEHEFPALRDESQPSLTPAKSPDGGPGGKKGSAGAPGSTAHSRWTGAGPSPARAETRGQFDGPVAQLHLRVNGTANACGART